jgi:hypothetical protein
MSHISKFKVKIYGKDMQAFRLACKELGIVLHEDAKQYQAYYQKENCDMMAEIPGVKHQIGLIKDSDGSYSIQCDTYGELGRKIGNNGSKLTDEFASQKIQINGRNRGWAIKKEAAKDKKKIRLVLTKY